MQANEPEDVVETNIKYNQAVWEIHTQEAALVLVDIWDRHMLKSHEKRCLEITRDKILPVLDIARKAGITIVHCPGRNVACKYPQCKRFVRAKEIVPSVRKSLDWPPENFRKRTGEYAMYAHPFLEAEVEKYGREHYSKNLLIPEIVRPVAGDFVVATGNQLHRLLKERRILHLFYAGFATNMCLIHKDYGVKATSGRGYDVILLRDCTTGVETDYTMKGLITTEIAIQQIENGNSSTTSEEFIEACEHVLNPPVWGRLQLGEHQKSWSPYA